MTMFNPYKLILEFSQDEINKFFNVGNSLTFFVKTNDGVHPIKLSFIKNPTGDEIKANLFFANVLSEYPIDLRNSTLLITQPNQNIQDGTFKVFIIGKHSNNGFTLNKKMKQYIFKNIFKVDIRDNNNKLIDTVFTNNNEKELNEPKETKARKEIEFNDFLLHLVKGEVLSLSFNDNTNINIKFIDKKNKLLQFEVQDNSNLPNDYSFLSDSSSIELFPDSISYNGKNDTVNINILGHYLVNGVMESDETNIKNIDDWSVLDETSTPEDTKYDKPKEENDETADDITRKAEEMVKAIINDPIMKKAFYKQPTLWNLILNTARGKNSSGTGIGPAWNIINQYGEAKQLKSLGPNGKNFKSNKPAQFEVMYEPLVINPTGLPNDELKFNPSPARYTAFVNPYKVDGDDRLTLESKKYGFKIRVLKPYKNVPDTFEASVIKIMRTKKTGEIKEFSKPAIIKFINENGSGYSKTELDKTQNTNI